MNEDLKKKNRLKFLNSNKKRHLELLKYSQYLKQQGKSLSHESKDDFLKLLLLLAVTRLIDKKPGKFYSEFYQKSIGNGEILDILESKLILLSPHEKSLDFSDFIQEILDYCESYNDDPDSLGENYDLYDNEFRDFYYY